MRRRESDFPRGEIHGALWACGLWACGALTHGRAWKRRGREGAQAVEVRHSGKVGELGEENLSLAWTGREGSNDDRT